MQSSGEGLVSMWLDDHPSTTVIYKALCVHLMEHRIPPTVCIGPSYIYLAVFLYISLDIE